MGKPQPELTPNVIPYLNFFLISTVVILVLCSGRLSLANDGKDYVSCDEEQDTLQCESVGYGELGCCSQAWDAHCNCTVNSCFEIPLSDKTDVTTICNTSERFTKTNPYENFGLALLQNRIISYPGHTEDGMVEAECDVDLYKKYNITRMWKRFLECPFDSNDNTSDARKTIDKLKLLWYFNNNIFKRLCLGSKYILECKNANGTDEESSTKKSTKTNRNIGKCKCLEIEKIGNLGMGGFKFNQTREAKSGKGLTCGQRVGQPCTLNVSDSTLKENGCTVTSRNKGIIPDTLTCEKDAGCETLTISEDKRTCPDNKICTCQCSEGRKCSGAKSSGCNSIIFASILVFSFLDRLNFYTRTT